MATAANFKRLAISRIKSANCLLRNKDWHMASYLMGSALECALKAVICKNLKLPDYPEKHKDKKVPDFFMTHIIDRLVLMSGLLDVFRVNGDPLVFNNW